MSIKLKVHSIDAISNSAIITVLDGDHIVLDKKNRYNLHFNGDGSANTEYLILCAKYLVFRDRLERLDILEDDLI